MPLLLTDNIACELGLSNDTQWIFGELIYDDQEDLTSLKVKSDVFPSTTIYIRIPLYALVEINTSQVETNLDDLPPKLIPVPLIKNNSLFPSSNSSVHYSNVFKVEKCLKNDSNNKNAITNRTCFCNNYLQGTRTYDEQNCGRSSSSS